MDPIMEHKVSAAATQVKVAYVMNRYAAIYGRTDDIDTFFATLTETVQSIYRDRQNETYTDADRILADLRNVIKAPSWYQSTVVSSYAGDDSSWVYRTPERKPYRYKHELTPCE